MKDVIVIGCDMAHMKKHAHQVASHYGVVGVILTVDEHHGGMKNLPVHRWEDFVAQYNAAIPLTEWVEIGVHGQPQKLGYYEVRYAGDAEDKPNEELYFWGGSRWKDVAGTGLFFGYWITENEFWRGLSEEPIKVKP